MDIKINKKIDCEVYSTILDVKFANEKRTDILAFLMFVNERNEVSTKDVNMDFLMQKDGNHPYGKRYVELMIGYGFLEYGRDSFRLSEQAAEMVEDKEVMLPERGNYRISVSDDPIFNHLVISIIDEDKIPKNIKEKGKKPEMPIKVSGNELVSIRESWEKEMLYLPLNEKKAIIDSVEACEKLPNETYDLTVTLSEKESVANIKRGDVSIIFAPQSIPKFDFVISEIAKKAGMPYSEKEKCVMVNRSGLKNIREGFLIDLPSTEIEFSEFGKYNILPTKNVPCMPDSESTAIEWVRNLVNKNVESRYTTEEQFNEVVMKEASKMERWYGTDNIMKDIDYQLFLKSLKGRMGTKDEVYWHLVATNDLSQGGST